MSDTLERIQRAIDHVEAHLFEDLPLVAIAERGGCSPWHFHRLFVSLTGETPATYVWKRRLSEICRRLVETRRLLVDVALDCGFESQATFTRAFTRHVGVSPGRFRRTQPHALPASCARRSTCRCSPNGSTGWRPWKHGSFASRRFT